MIASALENIAERSKCEESVGEQSSFLSQKFPTVPSGNESNRNLSAE